jgi:hypothetical protein
MDPVSSVTPETVDETTEALMATFNFKPGTGWFRTGGTDTTAYDPAVANPDEPIRNKEGEEIVSRQTDQQRAWVEYVSANHAWEREYTAYVDAAYGATRGMDDDERREARRRGAKLFTDTHPKPEPPPFPDPRIPRLRDFSTFIDSMDPYEVPRTDYNYPQRMAVRTQANERAEQPAVAPACHHRWRDVGGARNGRGGQFRDQQCAACGGTRQLRREAGEAGWTAGPEMTYHAARAVQEDVDRGAQLRRELARQIDQQHQIEANERRARQHPEAIPAPPPAPAPARGDRVRWGYGDEATHDDFWWEPAPVDPFRSASIINTTMSCNHQWELTDSVYGLPGGPRFKKTCTACKTEAWEDRNGRWAGPPQEQEDDPNAGFDFD